MFNYFKLSININKYDQFTDIVLTKWAGSTFDHQVNQGQAVNHQDEYQDKRSRWSRTGLLITKMTKDYMQRWSCTIIKYLQEALKIKVPHLLFVSWVGVGGTICQDDQGEVSWPPRRIRKIYKDNHGQDAKTIKVAPPLRPPSRSRWGSTRGTPGREMKST